MRYFCEMTFLTCEKMKTQFCINCLDLTIYLSFMFALKSVIKML